MPAPLFIMGIGAPPTGPPMGFMLAMAAFGFIAMAGGESVERRRRRSPGSGGQVGGTGARETTRRAVESVGRRDQPPGRATTVQRCRLAEGRRRRRGRWARSLLPECAGKLRWERARRNARDGRFDRGTGVGDAGSQGR